MQPVADALFAVEAARKRTEKVAALATTLADVAAREPARLAFVARLLTGTFLPVGDERVLGVGSALLFDAIASVTGVSPAELGALARAAGDLGTAAGEAMAKRRAGEAAPPAGLRLEEAEQAALALAESGARADKLRAIRTALATCSAREARYLVRALLGEMRVGAREGIVEEAIGKAFGRPLPSVRAAAGLVADVGVLAVLAHEDRLAEARIVLGRPVGFMLATPIEAARGGGVAVPTSIEDKIDGIRAQAHLGPEAGVRLFARGKGAVTTAFPDVTGPLGDAVRRGELPPAIVDGEIVVVAEDGRPRPFSALQPRLKKTTPDADLLRDHPVRYLVYDLLWEAGESVLAFPFVDRRARLVAWARRAPDVLAVHASRPLALPEAAEGEAPADRRAAVDAVLWVEFDAARSRGFEGLVLKRHDAPYAAGVRGFAWLKVKKALATLDVVIVAAERGHGRRAGVLSDYTFAVRGVGDELLTIGKAYSGLTDEEIAAMTDRLLALATAEEHRGRLPVRPEVVLEVAFDGLQRSRRHSSGFALRFPRITRIRDDKRPEDADTLAAVEALWEAQLATGHREDRTAKEPATKSRGRRSGRRPDVRKKSKQLRLFDDE